MSGAKCERPVNRYQPPDWYSRNSKLAYNASSLRDQSLHVRKESQLLNSETETKTKWQNYENNVRLSER